MKIWDRPSLLSLVIAREFRAISTSYAVLLVLVGGIFLYGLLYNYMYAPNHVTGAPVVVVDHSHSSLSREYARLLDATPQVDIYGYEADFREAEELMKQQKAVGILYLPRDFADRVFRGEEAVFVLYASTNAFLYYLSLQEASAYVMLAISDTYRTSGIVFLPLTAIMAVATAPAPINLSGTVLYNYTEGYGSYLIPAVLMLILFQTLMMVIGMLNGEEHYTGGLREYLSFGAGWGSALRIVCGKTFVYCMLYAVFALFLLGLIPRLFSVPHIGHGLDIVVMLIPFFLSHLLPGTGRFALLQRFGVAPADDHLLLRGAALPGRCLLPAGADALVLADGSLPDTGQQRHTGFCAAKLHGSPSGRHPRAVFRDVDTDGGLFSAGCVGVQG